MLHWNTAQERFELEVRWAAELASGRMRFRQLTPADSDAFCELWANAPEEIGEFDVTVERGPAAFAQFELQERPVLNGLFDGFSMVACASFSLRHTRVAGQRLWVNFGQALRVHKDHRRHGFGNWVRSLPWAIGLNARTQLQYDFIRGRNMTMERWNRRHMPEVASVPKRDDEVPGIPVTVLQFPAKPSRGGISGIYPATLADLDACAALINRTHRDRDLFRPYTSESLHDRLDPGPVPPGLRALKPYVLGDFHVVERAGEIVACAGAWDRGRDLRERWRHKESGKERTVSVVAMLDIGVAPGHEDALAALVEHFIGLANDAGRDYLVAPLETLPEVAALLGSHEPIPETRYMQWRAQTPALRHPAHLDLVYW
jgi:GNAT superfamily N-acetyltransferase